MALLAAILLAVFWLPRDLGILAVVVGAALEVGETLLWIRLSRRRRPATGAEALVGAKGVAVTACAPVGQGRVGGELWRARCPEGAEPGERVVVERLEPDLTLLVHPEARA